MPDASNQQQQQGQDTWTESMTHFAEAARLSITASRLATAGAVALTAAAAAYLWDTDRRNNLFQHSKKLSDDMMSWWGQSVARPGRGDAGSQAGNA